MEQEKKSSVFGPILLVLVLLGLVVYYLSNKNTPDENMTEQETIQTENVEAGNELTQTNNEAELEVEVNELDTEFEDMNVEDLDM